MGSFSWLKAHKDGEYRNIYYNSEFKFLIPKEFGGGYIIDKYQDYGYLDKKPDGKPKYDMYELLAIWNNDSEITVEDNTPLGFSKKPIKDIIKNVDWNDPMKEIDDVTDENRNYGIDIGCYDRQIKQLKYPLKLVDISFNGTYENCENPSLSDPDQGSCPVRWDGTSDDFDDDEE